MLGQLERIATPDRRETLSTASLERALRIAEGILSPLQEDGTESDSTNM